MKCPRCGFLEDRVVDTRLSKEGALIRRRRECLQCSHRFTTVEEIVPTELYVIKRDGRREEFNPQKIRDGIVKSCYKRPIRDDQLDDLMLRLRVRIESLGVREIPAHQIGEMVMEELALTDPVAYVRFASVYREFKDVDEFVSEVRQLKKKQR